MLAKRFTLLVLVLLAFSGCGLDARELSAPAIPPGSPMIQSFSQTSGTIGSAGGSLSTNGVTLVIPPLALSQATTVGLAVTESGGSYSIEVTPDGQSLSGYATVSVPCGTGSCPLLWLNPATEEWEDVTTSTSPTHVRGRIGVLSRLEIDELD